MRLLGMVAIAVDGTLRERKRGRGLSAKERKRMVLEAKIVTQLGWSITVMSEHLDPWSDEREKQDCEQRAFERLARRLKAAFPRLPVCILGDALYACRPVVGVCAANGWSYVLTAREERTPTMMAAARKAADRRGPAALGGGRSGEVRPHALQPLGHLECADIQRVRAHGPPDGSEFGHGRLGNDRLAGRVADRLHARTRLGCRFGRRRARSGCGRCGLRRCGRWPRGTADEHGRRHREDEGRRAETNTWGDHTSGAP